jgi:hypothetical protein
MTNIQVWMLTHDIFVPSFSGLMGQNENMLDVSQRHEDGNHTGVPNLVEMFSTIALVIRVSAWV